MYNVEIDKNLMRLESSAVIITAGVVGTAGNAIYTLVQTLKCGMQLHQGQGC